MPRSHQLKWLALGISGVAALLLDLAPDVTPPSGPKDLLRVARSAGTRLRKFDESDNADVDKPVSRPSGPKLRRGGSAGYDPQQIRHFWRHYRGAKPEPKEKGKGKQRSQ